MTLSELQERLKMLDIEQLCEEAFNEHSDDSAELNRVQLSVGVDADGRRIGSYTPYTREQKIKKGQEADFINLRDTGDFWNGITHRSISGSIIYDSLDWKQETLEREFGEKILGLDHRSKAELVVLIKPTLLELAQQKISGI